MGWDRSSSSSGRRRVERLNLNDMGLKGFIANSLADLDQLVVLDLSNNSLSGAVPSGLFRLRRLEILNLSSNRNRNLSLKITRVTSLGIGIGIGAAMAMVVLFLWIIKRKRWRRVEDTEKDMTELGGACLESSSGSSLVLLFQNKNNDEELTIDDIMKSTNNFDQANIIGCGGFGLVYKATLPDGRNVAIKRLNGEYGQMDREFRWIKRLGRR
ncbi:hypothetical protein ZOSMA_22G01350 [Zostera marina]|uniref:Protein kinase domain-containing protein n=1 Tax=Zostera marina TaxID=29655 RepID=A0A0K9PKR9_ZOSMR|nr:hypothetical protein ZOSMA_22G01350 [Zostera marina]